MTEDDDIPANVYRECALRERNWTLQRIADTFRCDHSSVIYNVRKMTAAINMIETYQAITNNNQGVRM